MVAVYDQASSEADIRLPPLIHLPAPSMLNRQTAHASFRTPSAALSFPDADMATWRGRIGLCQTRAARL